MNDVSYPYKVNIERERRIPTVEEDGLDLRVTQRIGETSVGQADFEIEYLLNEGICVTDSREIKTIGSSHSLIPTSRVERGLVGPIKYITMRPIHRTDCAVSIGRFAGIEADFRAASAESPFANREITEHWSRVYPWLSQHALHTGNLWLVAYGDSDETDQYPERVARIYQRTNNRVNPFTPPGGLGELWEMATSLHSETRVREFLDNARQLTD